MLDLVREGCPGLGPIRLLIAGAGGTGFVWNLPRAWLGTPGPAWDEQFGWGLCNNSGTLSWMLGVVRFLLIFKLARVFGVVPSSILQVPSSSSTRPMCGKEMRHCFAVFWLVGFGVGFC